jgi:succinate dehydrogenase / fumarate reductase cytochrome b subunit
MALPLTSDQPDRSVEPEARAVAREFILARMGSLLALLPLGAWTAVHLWNQLAAYDSAEAWQRAVTWHSSSASTALSFMFVLVPLVWHTGWGAVRMLRSRPVVRIGWLSNVRYIVQRLSAVGLLFFLGAHLYLAWFEPRFLRGHAEIFADISREMRFHTPTLIVYVLGVLAISYHLANGFWSWSMAWGVTVSKSGLAWMERVALLLFFLFLALGWVAIYGLYRNG